MKHFFTLFLILGCFAAKAQYTNSWIDYNKTYYKFTIGTTGVYRIEKAVLDNLSLSGVPAEHFQLWRNGEEVPLYVSNTSGIMGTSDYLEFWGEKNDGKMDTKLYQALRNQHSDRSSLFTDTAAFFLTINAATPNKRLLPQTFDLQTNQLPKEEYFMHSAEFIPKNRMNPGLADVGGIVLSSAFDKGEFWSTGFIGPGGAGFNIAFGNLFAYQGAVTAKLKVGMAGCLGNARKLNLKLNNTPILADAELNFYNDSVFKVEELPASMISTSTTTINLLSSSVAGDRVVVSYAALEYARAFNFGNAANFEFTLPASPAGNYLEISGFAAGAIAPVVYDLTNGARYVANNATSGVYKVVLKPSAVPRKLVMVSQIATNNSKVVKFRKRDFVDLFAAANQGDYLIISNPLLRSEPSGDPVEEYRAYRSSVVGGGYNAKIYDVNELEDQFAYGIIKHSSGIKEFLRFARGRFAVKPKFVFLLGRGTTYDVFYAKQNLPEAYRLNLIPTFGNPGSDNFLASEDSRIATPATSIGRLAVINATEISEYLDKVKTYELAQRTPSCSITDKAWMKNVVQVTGASDAHLGIVLCDYMRDYTSIISDTAFGAKVTTFCKTTTTTGQEVAGTQLGKLFEEGMSFLTYFGHSSATVLEFNISDPENYNNQGKYPVFFVNGCNAGNFFTYDLGRLAGIKNLTEKFTLAKDRGAIAFVASTHFGVVNYLNVYIDGLYKLMAKTDYGNTLGQTHVDAMNRILAVTGSQSFLGRVHVEQITLHGDPALRLNTFGKPDYAVEDAQLKVTPNFLTVAENKFSVDAKIFNLGKSTEDSIRVHIIRKLPDNSIDTLFNKKIAGVHSLDSIHLTVPIIATRDRGVNKIIVTVDADGNVDELCESNNSITKDVVIYGDDARPIHPYNFSIIKEPIEVFRASTSDPFGKTIAYKMQIDTTELFNSPKLHTAIVNSSGGLLEFKPDLGTGYYKDSVVYYWRTAVEPQDGGPYKWSGSSFVYLENSAPGWNQSHYYQYQKNDYKEVRLTENRDFVFDKKTTALKFQIGVYPVAAPIVMIDDVSKGGSTCGTYLNSVVFMLIDKNSGKIYPNNTVNGEGLYGSLKPNCPDNGILANNTFLFYYNNQDYRNRAKLFLENVPPNTIVAMWHWGSTGFNSNPRFIADWQKDTTVYGHNQSLYHKLKSIGSGAIDSFYHNVPFVFVMEKTETNVLKLLSEEAGATSNDVFVHRYNFERFSGNGTINALETSGALKWNKVLWDSEYGNGISDESEFRMYGIKSDFSEELLYTSPDLKKDTTLDFIDPTVYKKLRLELFQLTPNGHVPRQLKYWQIKSDELPEGALNANAFFSTKDTVDVGEEVNFKIAFKNVSKTDFPALNVKLQIIDRNNVTNELTGIDLAALKAGVSDTISTLIDTRKFPGENTIFLDVNPEGQQPEQHHFNNFLYRNLYVRPDNTNPLLDVTFDGQHILNKDIVSSKPHILIKLKDDAKFMPLNDLDGATITLRYLDGSGWTKTYAVDGNILVFTPPADPKTDNTASFDFRPELKDDGEYELTINGKDKSENTTGSIEYKVIFQVYNKPMISNMLNYPNPFTSSTAFVFTITGNEIPQNIRIQVMTVTGKIVREITKSELGPLRIGRNITEFKWDGTDQYGQKLANGIYLYRVITNLNGKSLDKFKPETDKTDKFFTQGYGKMYLMR